MACSAPTMRAGASAVPRILRRSCNSRAHDGASQGDPQNTGYTRVLLTPGLELDYGRTRVYADVGRALCSNVSSNQLVVRTLIKVSVSVQF